jgi:hypothetical protein
MTAAPPTATSSQTPSVVLGLPGELVDPQQPPDHYGTRIGGTPVYPGAQPPQLPAAALARIPGGSTSSSSSTMPRCRVCGAALSLILQVGWQAGDGTATAAAGGAMPVLSTAARSTPAPGPNTRRRTRRCQRCRTAPSCCLAAPPPPVGTPRTAGWRCAASCRVVRTSSSNRTASAHQQQQHRHLNQAAALTSQQPLTRALAPGTLQPPQAAAAALSLTTAGVRWEAHKLPTLLTLQP